MLIYNHRGALIDFSGDQSNNAIYRKQCKSNKLYS